MNKLFLAVLVIVSMIFVSSCDKPYKKSDRYYYSEENLKSYKGSSDTIVDLNNDTEIFQFIYGREFFSKSSNLVFNDSTHVSIFNNGKLSGVYEFKVGEYSLKEERLILFTDSLSSTILKFTLAPSGSLTDRQSYSIYQLRD